MKQGIKPRFSPDTMIHVIVGLDPSWYIQHVVVWDLQTDHMFFFLLEDWLSVDNHKNSTVDKEVLASCMFIHIGSSDTKNIRIIMSGLVNCLVEQAVRIFF